MRKESVILDISWLPYLEHFVNIKSIQIFVPDTLNKLLTDIRYEEYLVILINKWFFFRNPKYNVKTIKETYNKLKEQNIIRMITSQEVDQKLFSFILENIKNKKLLTELSEKKNILGDIIGKMLGYSYKTGTVIIAKTSALGIMLRYKMPILYHSLIRNLQSAGGGLDEFIDKKQKYFQKNLQLKKIKGMKFIIWIANFASIGTVLNLLEP